MVDYFRCWPHLHRRDYSWLCLIEVAPGISGRGLRRMDISSVMKGNFTGRLVDYFRRWAVLGSVLQDRDLETTLRKRSTRIEEILTELRRLVILEPPLPMMEPAT